MSSWPMMVGVDSPIEREDLDVSSVRNEGPASVTPGEAGGQTEIERMAPTMKGPAA